MGGTATHNQSSLMCCVYLNVVYYPCVCVCSCLEAIISEQVGKLTATIRGIRTLDSFARETESKLRLMSQQSEVCMCVME